MFFLESFTFLVLDLIHSIGVIDGEANIATKMRHSLKEKPKRKHRDGGRPHMETDFLPVEISEKEFAQQQDTTLKSQKVQTDVRTACLDDQKQLWLIQHLMHSLMSFDFVVFDWKGTLFPKGGMRGLRTEFAFSALAKELNVSIEQLNQLWKVRTPSLSRNNSC